MFSELLNNCVEPEFATLSLGDYFASANESYSSLLAAITDACTYADEFAPSQSRSIAIAICNKQGINNDMYLTTGKGQVKLYDAIEQILLQVENYASNDDQTVDYLNNNVINAYNLSGTSVSNQMSVNDFVDSIKSNYESSVAMMSSLYASVFDSLSDRLNTFKEKFYNVFTEASSRASATAQLLIDKLSAKDFSTSGFREYISVLMGVDSRVSVDSGADESTIYNYTGCNPIATLDFSTATKAVGAVGKVIFESVKSVFSLIKKGINFVAKKIYQVAINPVDLKLVSNDGNNTIGPWSIEENSHFSMDGLEILHDNITGHWYKWDTIFAEVLFIIDSIELVDYETHRYTVNYRAKTRLKPINPNSLEYSLNSTGYHMCTYTDKQSFSWNVRDLKCIDMLTAFSNIPYQSGWRLNLDTASEADMWFGFKLSAHMLYYYNYCMYKYLQNPESTMDAASLPSGVVNYKQTVTNLDFLQIASGFNGDYTNPSFSWNVIIDGIENANIVSVNREYGRMLITQQIMRQQQPLNYFFLPYRKDQEDLKSYKYEIKTDKENSDLFSKFLGIVITVVILATVAISAAVVVRKITKSLFWKRTSFVSQCDNKLWEGGKLTRAEKRKYVRYSRKLNASTLLTSGLQSSVGDFIPTVSGVSPDSQLIIDLIRGN